MNSFRFFLAPTTSLTFVPQNFSFRDWEGSEVQLRPFQQEAIEKILQRVYQFSTHFSRHSVIPGGVVRHASGSGKTLTAFCTAQLAATFSGVKKVFFLVDETELDWRAIRHFESLEFSSINFSGEFESINTALKLSRKVLIPTTLQKLSAWMQARNEQEVIKKHTVFIYDECQSRLERSFRNLISRLFPNSQHYFFTGVPRLEVPEYFLGPTLHSYSLSRAIEEQNLLPLNIQSVPIKSFVKPEGIPEVDALNEARSMMAPERIARVVQNILKNYKRKSENRSFNSILAVSDVISAMNYYVELRRQMKRLGTKLKLAVIYAPKGAEELVSWRQNEFLELAVEDYNAQFQTNFSSAEGRFPEYVQDVSRRMTLGEIDLLLVVDYFLTSFDSSRLNTLWVDRDFTPNALVRAFSRTNRLNAYKKAGNVVCFRDLSCKINEFFPPETFERQ